VRARGLRAAAVGALVAAAVLLALGGPARGGGTGASAASRPDTPQRRGRELFVRMGCGGCHRLAAGAGIGQVAPDLDALLPTYDAASLRAKIVTPYAVGPVDSFVLMPEDFGRRMDARQLDDLVAFLLGTVRR
jgi:mono/diheme cytochrome c family protein